VIADEVLEQGKLPRGKAYFPIFKENLMSIDIHFDRSVFQYLPAPILEIPSPASGTLVEVRQPEGAVVKADEVVAVIETGEGVAVAGPAEKPAQPAPAAPVVFDQKGCHYEPHVFGIQAGQPLEILNSDDALHNVHALPKNTQEFNLGMPIKGMKLTKTFTAPEVAVKIKCEVHPWMAAYAGVLDHPFYAVTGEDGSFSLKDLPPGEYVVEAWHEKYGTQTQTVKVPETSEVSFTFKAL